MQDKEIIQNHSGENKGEPRDISPEQGNDRVSDHTEDQSQVKKGEYPVGHS